MSADGVRASAPESLLQGDGQLSFIDALNVETHARFQSGEGEVFEFTGERLVTQYPLTYRAIVEALGMPNARVAVIARTLKVSPNTVRGVRDREGISIDQLRSKALKNWTRFLADGTERLAENVDNIPITQLSVPLGIAAQNIENLGGQSVEAPKVEDRDDTADLNRLIMGLGGESGGQKGDSGFRAVGLPGGGSAGPGEGAPARIGDRHRVAGDSESLGLQAAGSGAADRDTVDATASAARPGAERGAGRAEEGGRGSADFATPPSEGIHPSATDFPAKDLSSPAPWTSETQQQAEKKSRAGCAATATTREGVPASDAATEHRKDAPARKETGEETLLTPEATTSAHRSTPPSTPFPPGPPGGSPPLT